MAPFPLLAMIERELQAQYHLRWSLAWLGLVWEELALCPEFQLAVLSWSLGLHLQQLAGHRLLEMMVGTH